MVARSNIRRVRVMVESSIGADGTGTIGDLDDIRITQVERPSSPQEFIADGRVRSKRVLAPPSNLGWRRGQLTVGGQLVSTNTEYNASATPAQDALSIVLGAIMGGQADAAGSLVASGSSATGVTVTSTQGDRFPEGTIVGVETGVASGIFVCTAIDTRSTDALTFTHSVGFTPAVGAKVINSDMFFETDQPSGTLQWLVEGENRNDIALYIAAQGNLGINWPLGQEITWTSQQMFANWIHDDEIATPQGGSAMSVYTVPGSRPIIGRSGSIVFTPTSGTTRTTPNVAALTFDPSITWQMVEGWGDTAVQGVVGYERVVGQPMATIQVPGTTAGETYKDAMDAGTTYRLFAQAGNAGGSMLALHLPTVQIVGIADASVNGLDYVTLSLMCLPDAGLTDQSTDLLRAPYRLARL